MAESSDDVNTVIKSLSNLCIESVDNLVKNIVYDKIGDDLPDLTLKEKKYILFISGVGNYYNDFLGVVRYFANLGYNEIGDVSKPHYKFDLLSLQYLITDIKKKNEILYYLSTDIDVYSTVAYKYGEYLSIKEEDRVEWLNSCHLRNYKRPSGFGNCKLDKVDSRLYFFTSQYFNINKYNQLSARDRFVLQSVLKFQDCQI